MDGPRGFQVSSLKIILLAYIEDVFNCRAFLGHQVIPEPLEKMVNQVHREQQECQDHKVFEAKEDFREKEAQLVNQVDQV